MTEVDRRLDEVSKALARGHTRRSIVKLGLGMVGAAVAAIVPGRAGAHHDPDHTEGGGSSACAHACNDLPPGNQRARCLHVCKDQCGFDPTRFCPLGGDPVRCCPPGEACCGTSACCDPDQNCCSSQNRCVTCRADQVFDPATCTCECPAGQIECPGGGTPRCVQACVPPRVLDPTTCACVCPPATRECGPGGPCCPTAQECCGNVCCAPGLVCRNGQCETPQVCSPSSTCANLALCGSPPSGRCICFATADGTNFCYQEFTGTCAKPCSSTLTCDPGEVCVVNTCCPGPICLNVAETRCRTGTTALVTAATVEPARVDELTGNTPG